MVVPSEPLAFVELVDMVSVRFVSVPVVGAMPVVEGAEFVSPVVAAEPMLSGVDVDAGGTTGAPAVEPPLVDWAKAGPAANRAKAASVEMRFMMKTL